MNRCSGNSFRELINASRVTNLPSIEALSSQQEIRESFHEERLLNCGMIFLYMRQRSVNWRGCRSMRMRSRKGLNNLSDQHSESRGWLWADNNPAAIQSSPRTEHERRSAERARFRPKFAEIAQR